MQKLYQKFLVMLAVFLSIAGMEKAYGQGELPPQYYHLTNNTWKVAMVYVDNQSYSDTVTTNIRYTFHLNGECALQTQTGSGNTTWEFRNNFSQLVLTPGTQDEYIYTIERLDKDMLY
jgi:hypothetical protein